MEYGEEIDYQSVNTMLRSRIVLAQDAHEGVMRRLFGVERDFDQYRPVTMEGVYLNYLLDKYGKNGFVFISIEKTTREFVRAIRKTGYSYLPVYGRQFSTTDNFDPYNPSFILFNGIKEWRQCDDFDKLMGTVRVIMENFTIANIVCYDCRNVVYGGNVEGELPFYRHLCDKFDTLRKIDEISEKLYSDYCTKYGVTGTKSGLSRFKSELLSDRNSEAYKLYHGGFEFDDLYVNPLTAFYVEGMMRINEVIICR